jgi:rare lipoprotein A
MAMRRVALPAIDLLAGALVLAAACAHREPLPATVDGPRERLPVTRELVVQPEGGQVGYATWYGGRLAGRTTASGERFDPRQMTAAHRTLPFGTWVEVRRLDTGDAVRVRITDRGPFGHEERIIDLSQEAARRLGMLKGGVARVELRQVGGP